LLAVSEAIVSHRDLPALPHQLASPLHQAVRFDSLTLFLHDDASSARPMALDGWRFPCIPWVLSTREI
jgi:hypothetical protein